MRQYYEDEERDLLLGVTSSGRTLAIVTTWRQELVRVDHSRRCPCKPQGILLARA